MYQFLNDCDIIILSKLVRKVKTMVDYNEISEVKQDLELCYIDLDGAIERLAIEIDCHRDLFEREKRSEEANSMVKMASDAAEILNDLIDYLESKTEDKS